jgi:hypothetical protein
MHMVRLREESSKREFDEIETVTQTFSLASNEDKCKKILEIDDTIKFAGISTNDGQILAAQYKPGSTPFFDDINTEFLISKQILLAMENTQSKEKLGQLMYSVMAYENLKRATFALDDDILLISFDKSGDENEIVNKIIYDVGLG